MIKLKNGHEVTYDKDFDQFFKNLIESIMKESRTCAEQKFLKQTNTNTMNDFFLKEIMDNCIYVTHQLFQIAKQNEDFSKFMVSGFLFNSIILALPHGIEETKKDKEQNKESLH